MSHSWSQLLIHVCLVHNEAVTLKLTSNTSREGCITAFFFFMCVLNLCVCNCSKLVVKLILCNLGRCCMILG